MAKETCAVGHVGGNASCPRGRGTRDNATSQGTSQTATTARGLPPWICNSRRKLYQFEKYAIKVFNLPRLLQRFTDSRRRPRIATFDVINSLVHTALLRIPSTNALEGDLKEADFQKLLGLSPKQDVKAFSAEVVFNVLDKLDLHPAHEAMIDVFRKAERTKALRQERFGPFRCAALDGWEQFCSYHRHCPDCLEREVERKDGEIVTQYYHRYVVAVLVGPLLDVVLGIEPVRSQSARMRAGEHDARGDEGELTAAHRLIDRIHQIYGAYIDAFIFDSLYPNGPVLTKLTAYNYEAFIVMKKEDNEPLKEALALWHAQPPCHVLDDHKSKEHIEFWDVDELETLDTYKGKIRVFKAVVTHPEKKKRTWCVAAIGLRARRLSLPLALNVTRARWHIENTAFHQWVTYWNLSHVFHHTANAIMAIVLLWVLVFNLLQFFVYRRLKRPRRPKDPTYTIRHIVEVMLREIATLPKAIPWLDLLDTK
jgi:hypothetical protein